MDWLSIWIHPRQVTERALQKGYGRHILWLIILGNFAQTATREANRNLGDDHSTGYVLFAILIAALISVPLTLYIVAPLLRWTGSWLGGQGDTDDIRIAFAYGSIPMIWTLPVLLADYALLGEKMFQSSLTMPTEPFALMVFLLLTILKVIMVVWGIVVFLNAIAAAHRFSGGRALLCCIIPGFILILVVILLTVVASL
ncbi:YIP1 family protein [Gorillibacterium timonense]|uniref:YIP1 family protein n=1 Tax=Gorillibacterium timonense TaxID=1689269 RepID=UPI00071E2EF0|nr:YIP1 family protein [Gorillibacterium timonense]